MFKNSLVYNGAPHHISYGAMGLREKVALATVAVLAAQIVISHCMPRGLPNGSIKRHISSLISPKGDDRIRELKTNRKLKKSNIIAGNSSIFLNLPKVADRTDYEAAGYYRFLGEYPQESNTFSNSLRQTRNFKREAKHKRYLDIAVKDKARLPITSSGLAHDALPQPYCFRKSNFFPEVEYPLSARDMWIPKYWSRLLDAEVPCNVKNDAPISQYPLKHTKSYSSYDNSPLYDIIKTLNTLIKTEGDRIDSNNNEEFAPMTSEDASIPNITSPNNILNTRIQQAVDTTSSSDIHSEVLSYTPTTTEVYPVLESVKSSSVASSIPGAFTITSVNRNLSTLPFTTAPMIPNIVITTSTATTDLENYYFDVIDVTTTSPFEDLTSPMTHYNIASTDNFISQTHMKEMPTTLSTTVISPQAQELQTSLPETNTAASASSQLISFTSSEENRPEQELKAHTIPMPYTKSESYSNFDIIDATISPFDLFTTPMTHSEVLADNSILHTQIEKIPSKVSTTVTSTKDQEGELHLSETFTEPTTISSLLSFSCTTENKSEHELRDYTIPMKFTPTSEINTTTTTSVDEVATDSDSFSSDSSDLVPSLNLTPENTPGVNDKSVSVPSNILQENFTDLDTNESLLKHEVLKNSVCIKSPNLPNHSCQTKDISLPADKILPKIAIERDNSLRPLTREYSNHLSNDGVLQSCTNDSSNSSIIFKNDYKENWVFSPNDSYIIWDTIPEYPEECFIFVDTENTPSSQVLCSGNDSNLLTKPKQSLMTSSEQSGLEKNENSILSSSGSIVAMEKIKSQDLFSKQLNKNPQSNVCDPPDNTEVSPTQSRQENEKVEGLRALNNIENCTDSASIADNSILSLPSISNQLKFRKVLNDSCFLLYDINRTGTCEDVDEKEAIVNYLMQESSIDENVYSAQNNTASDLILYVEASNSTLENVLVNADETWASYTEIPFGFLDLNPEDANTNGNNYAIYQQILPEDSDDTTLLFLDTEKTTGLLNDIIFNVN